MQLEENLLWIDMEMTGLDVTKNKILEFACIVTDKDLNILALGPDLPVKVSSRYLKRMDEWNKTHHTDSGLINRVKEGGVPIKKIEKMVLDFIKEYCVEGRTVIAGSSIHQDRKFINKEMPKLAKYLHYRMVDISTIRELAKRWYPNLEEFVSKDAHRALDDIQESIEKMRFMREKIFK